MGKFGERFHLEHERLHECGLETSDYQNENGITDEPGEMGKGMGECVYTGRSTAWGLISHSLQRVESIEDF